MYHHLFKIHLGSTCIKIRAELLILHKPIHAVAMEEFEKREDCFILDFDPDDTLDISKLSVANGTINADSSDISVVAEKGQVYQSI